MWVIFSECWRMAPKVQIGNIWFRTFWLPLCIHNQPQILRTPQTLIWISGVFDALLLALSLRHLLCMVVLTFIHRFTWVFAAQNVLQIFLKPTISEEWRLEDVLRKILTICKTILGREIRQIKFRKTGAWRNFGLVFVESTSFSLLVVQIFSLGHLLRDMRLSLFSGFSIKKVQ